MEQLAGDAGLVGAVMSERQYCTFLVDELLFGIDVELVDEIVRDRPITRVPHTHGHIAGLANLRGRIVSVVDVRSRFEMAACPVGLQRTMIVVRADEEVVGLLVDRVGDIVDLSEQEFQGVPVTIAPSVAR